MIHSESWCVMSVMEFMINIYYDHPSAQHELE